MCTTRDTVFTTHNALARCRPVTIFPRGIIRDARSVKKHGQIIDSWVGTISLHCPMTGSPGTARVAYLSGLDDVWLRGREAGGPVCGGHERLPQVGEALSSCTTRQALVVGRACIFAGMKCATRTDMMNVEISNFLSQEFRETPLRRKRFGSLTLTKTLQSVTVILLQTGYPLAHADCFVAHASSFDFVGPFFMR